MPKEVIALLKPLNLGNKTFPVNIVQGPLAGYTCSAFRLLTCKYSQPAFTCTEMISCNSLMHRRESEYQRYVKKQAGEGPVCFQLFGSDPQKLGLATKIVTDYGADLIDLNCGCPVKKVRSRGAGSKLLNLPITLYKLIVAMKQNTHLPVSIKIRVEGYSDERFHNSIVQVVKDSGVDFLVVHGRHWEEPYSHPCHYDQIKFFVDELKIPVIGNGDVSDINSLRKMFETGCSGAMIGRAGIGKPWLIRKLIAEMNNEKFIEPSMEEIGLIFLSHIELLGDLVGEKFALLHARKISHAYTSGLRNKKDFCCSINGCNSMKELKEISERYFL